MRFCENGKCRYHRYEDNGTNTMMCFDLQHPDGFWIEVHNFLYRSSDGSKEYKLCETCHNAVEIVTNNDSVS